MSAVLDTKPTSLETRHHSRNEAAIEEAMANIDATLAELEAMVQPPTESRFQPRVVPEPAVSRQPEQRPAPVRPSARTAAEPAPRPIPAPPAQPSRSPEPPLTQAAPAPRPAPPVQPAPQSQIKAEAQPQPQSKPPLEARNDSRADPAFPRSDRTPEMAPVLDGEALTRPLSPKGGGGGGNGANNGGGGGGGRGFHKPAELPDFAKSFQNGINAVRRNLAMVMIFTVATNILVLAIPIYLFQISDRVLTSRSVDTLVMLTIAVIGAVVLQAVLDAIRRFILMRTAVELEVQLGAPVLSAAARSSLNGSSKDYHILGDLQKLRSFITSGTLISILDAPLAPLFILAVFLVHPHLGFIVIGSCLALLVFATINQRMTARHFSDANGFLSRATLHLDSMSRNAQIINALAMIPEAVRIWGRDTAYSLKSQVRAQDRNVIIASISKSFRMLTQVAMLGWGAYLALSGEITGGMVIAASIIAARALTPIEGAIEGWHHFTQFRTSFKKIRGLLQTSPLNTPRLRLPQPQGRLDVERILFVPPPTKKVILNGISFTLQPGESLAIIGNSGSGKTTLGKMLVGSILPTSGNVRLDLMDLRNWDMRQFGESIGYLPQDVQLFPGTIKANIARMRDDASDRAIYDAAVLADVHEMIATLPQGYETVVAADGAPLSGGQKQRIALARAFFGAPRLVVLDEPNSNLDSPGEAALAKALIHAKKQGITVVTITQRTALLNYVDKIMVLNNGSVAMLGERAKVLAALTQGPAGPQISSREDDQ
ncbi:type I secretion system permease/ATPase [Pelagibacterium sp. 26DY04]|nr:type I secretion system permease/ATPase [Pelagibacterium sp. 26DY04]WMT86773.1 type I secretion system permease/ATPase [Pelagibacterium sp. 26DY04]